MTRKNKTGTIREIDCDEVMRQLFDYLDGEVDETADHEIDQHIDECRSCFSRVEFEKALKERVRESTEQDLPESLQNRVTELMKSFRIAKGQEGGKDRK